MKEKTKTVLYLNVIVFVLVASLVVRTRQLREAFQAMGIPGTSTPVVKCIGADGISQCRFVDVEGSTPNTLMIRERTNSPSQYAFCPKTSDGKQTSYDSSTASCIPPSDSADKTPVVADPAKITCPIANEQYFPAIKRCAVTAGTVPRCIPDNATATSPEVVKAMGCYADRNRDVPSVSNLGKDTTLLWNNWSTYGVYNLLNPCCDPESEPAPPGTIKIGDTIIEKDWKFWTAIVVVVLLIVWSVL